LTYLIDSSALIEPHKRIFSFDVCPGYWDWLESALASGKVRCIHEVRSQILAGDDRLKDWVKGLPGSYFEKIDAKRAASMATVSAWVTNLNFYTPGAVGLFLSDADFHVISHAHAYSLKVVALEERDLKTSRVNMPKTCDQLHTVRLTPRHARGLRCPAHMDAYTLTAIP
jgi:hypothetical protein